MVWNIKRKTIDLRQRKFHFIAETFHFIRILQDFDFHRNFKASDETGHDKHIGNWKSKGVMIPPFEGAQTSLYCALAPELTDAKYNGLYFDDCKVKKSKYTAINAENDENAQKLWDISVKLTNSDFPKTVVHTSF